MRRSAWLAAILWIGAAPAATAAWDPTSAELTRSCSDALRRAEAALRVLSAIPAEARGFSNTPAALEAALQDLEDAAASAVLLARVSVSSSVREAGGLCEARLDEFAAGLPERAELLRALEDYAGRGQTLAGEDRELLERQLALLRRGGSGLDRESRLELRYLRERLAVRERSFLDNLDWPRLSLHLTEAELAGLPPAVLRSLPRQGHLVRVEAEPGLYAEFMPTVRDASARQRLEFLFRNRAATSNGSVLREILALRGRIAGMLKASSWARLALAERLVAEPGRVRGILKTLAERLRPQARQQLSAMRELKLGEPGRLKRSERRVRAWERDYYAARLGLAAPGGAAPARPLPEAAAVDEAFAKAGHLLGLSLSRASKAEVWHPSVTFHEVRDARSAQLLGRLYLDLSPRRGKVQGSSVFVLDPGRDGAGGRRIPVCALLASFPSSRGALLDLEDFYHGLGHVLPVFLARNRYAWFSGANLSRDAVEIPALLLGRLAGRGGAALWPWHALDDLTLAWADLEVHDKGADPGRAWRGASEDFGLVPATPGTHPEASAAALVRDPAGASGPVLAALLAEELWRRWNEEGLFNPAAGMHLRETFFSASAAQTAQGLRNYLGREPSWSVLPAPEGWPVLRGEAPAGPAWRRRVLY
jgi:Zn-dependent oligopeptidase